MSSRKYRYTIRLSAEELALLHCIDESPAKAFRSLLEQYRCSRLSIPFDQFLLELYPILLEIYKFLQTLETENHSNYDLQLSIYIRSRICDMLDIIFRHY